MTSFALGLVTTILWCSNSGCSARVWQPDRRTEIMSTLIAGIGEFFIEFLLAGCLSRHAQNRCLMRRSVWVWVFRRPDGEGYASGRVCRRCTGEWVGVFPVVALVDRIA